MSFDAIKSAVSRHMRLLQVALIICAGLVVYANTLHVPFVLDDYPTLIHYGARDLPDILLHGGPRRVVDATFSLNYALHGLKLPGYHLANGAIHLASAVVLYFIAGSLISALKTVYPRQEHTGAIDTFVPLAVALLFVCHPLQTQAVTYIIQRYTSLAALFYLAAVAAFLRSRLAYERGGASGAVWGLGTLALVAGILAMGSKQIAVTLPILLVIIELVIFKGRLLNRTFLAVCGILFLVTCIAVAAIWQPGSPQDLVRAVTALTTEDPRIPRLTYFYTQTRVVAGYLRLLFLPLGQSVVHDSPRYSTLFSGPVLAALALHGSLMLSALALFRRAGRNLAEGEWTTGALQRLACLGIIWFYCTMAVESSIFPIRDVMFEHRVYLPSAGFFITVTSLGILAAWKLRIERKPVMAVTAAVCIVLGALTIARNQKWNTPLLLWQDAVRNYPDNPLALANLGGEYLKLKMPEKTVPLYVRTMELGGEFQPTNLGIALKAVNVYGDRFTTGKEFMRPGGPLGSGELAPEDEMKYRGVIFNMLALAYEYIGNTEQALVSYRRSLKADPAYDLAWFNQALLFDRLGDKNGVVSSLSRLKAINPELARDLEGALAHRP